MSAQGIVFNIQRFTIHDGPGMRTEIFLKGCPLRCRWCSNPEGIKPYIQPGVYRKKCISHRNCGICESSCPEVGALQFYRQKLVSIDRAKCTGCMACEAVCPSEAVKQWGKAMTVDECMNAILRDRGYYERSGGGVTVSGGDPLMQSDFVAELFTACKAENIHTCCESTFHTDWSNIEKILPVTDLLISDIKHMDAAVHKEYTGVDNMLILENLKRLADEGREMILRIPVIPGINDDSVNIKRTADFIESELGDSVRTLQLLSFMRLGVEKYQSLGIPYGMEDIRFNRRSLQKRINEIAEYFSSRGIHCLVGTREQE